MDIIAKIKKINKRVNEIARVFGLDSREYQAQKSLVESYVPESLLTTKNRAGATTISLRERNRQAITALATDLEPIFDRAIHSQKILGTAYAQSKKYGISNKSDFNKYIRNDELKRIAHDTQKISNSTDDFYSMISEIDDDELRAGVIAQWRSRRGKRGDIADSAYWQAVNATLNAMARDAMQTIDNQKSTAIGNETEIDDLSDRITKLLGN